MEAVCRLRRLRKNDDCAIVLFQAKIHLVLFSLLFRVRVMQSQGPGDLGHGEPPMAHDECFEKLDASGQWICGYHREPLHEKVDPSQTQNQPLITLICPRSGVPLKVLQ
jgi:hypothetical protein